MSGRLTRGPADPKLGRDLFSSLHIARLTGVAPRTVVKWIDRKRLRGFRVPGSKVRRVLRADLLAFLVREGWPVPPSLAVTRPAAALLPDPPPGLPVVTAFDLAGMAHRGELSAVVLGCLRGLDAAVELARGLSAACPGVPVGLVLGEDRSPADVPAGVFARVFPADVNGELTAFLGGRS